MPPPGRDDVRRLAVEFATLAEFEQEYRRSLANGGIFLASEDVFSVGEKVDVELRLPFRGGSVVLRGEVVSFVPARFSPLGGHAGIGVQFLEPAPKLRARLGALAGLESTSRFQPTAERPVCTRAGERSPARVPVRLEVSGRRVETETRDLSRSGVLVSVDATPVPLGDPVKLTLVHPTHGEELQLRGTVVRHVEGEGRVTAAAIRFEVAGAAADTAQQFIESVQSADHARRLGMITGPLAPLGLANLLQMFSSGTERGTLAVLRSGQAGFIEFELGALRHTRVGRVTGGKALARLLAWQDGTFEFQAGLDPSLPTDRSTPMYGAILEAIQQVDELNRLDLSGLPASAGVVLDPELGSDELQALEKTEQEVALAVGKGAAVRDVVDRVARFDAEVYTALLALVGRGVVRVEP